MQTHAVDPGIALGHLRAAALAAVGSDADLAELAPSFEALHVDGQEVVFKQGDPGDALYVVGTGRLDVYRNDDGVEHLVGRVGPGTVFGEAALLRGEPRAATLRAARDSVIYRLSADGFRDLAKRCPQSILGLVRLMLHRAEDVNRVDARPGVTAVIPIGDPEAARAVAEGLADASRDAGVDAIAGTPPEDPGAAAAWLAGEEAAHRRVLVLADPSMTGRTRFAVRNAERVLLVAGAAERAPGEFERAAWSQAGRERAELVFAQAKPDGTAREFEALRPEIPVTAIRLDTTDLAALAHRLPGGLRDADWLRACAVFKDLDDVALASAAKDFTIRTLLAGDALFHRGDPGDALFVVIAGRLVVEDAERHRIGPGDVVGEIGLYSSEGRGATVRALRDAVVARLDRAHYDALLARQPGIGRLLARIALERLRGSGRSGRRPELAIAYVPIGPGDAEGLAHELADALGRLDLAAVLTSTDVDLRLGQGTSEVAPRAPGDSTLLRYLSEVEEQNPYVVYLADPKPSEWTKRCLRQADVVLLAAPADGSPELTALERDLYHGEKPPPGTAVLLYHPPGARRASGTAKWLTARQLERAYHVRTGETSDLERAARLMTSRGVGLALGGGGSRGVAHLGVYRAFRDLGIPIDAVGGTSAGSALSAAIAAGFTPDETAENLVKLLTSTMGHFASMGPPFSSLMSGAHIRRLLGDWFGDADMEDLFVPLVCASADIDGSKLVAIRTGPVWEGVRASVSLPGVWPPVIRDGRRHVDGGVLNNLPADLLRGDCRHGAVIASDISTNQGLREAYPAYPNQALSGWGLLFGGAGRYPGIGDIIGDTMVLSSNNHLQETLRRDADVVLNPRLVGVGMFDVRDRAGVEKGAAIGYEEAKRHLSAFDWHKHVGFE